MKAILQIRIPDNHSASITFGGDMAAIAREIGHIARDNEEFALALNMAMIAVNDERRAIEIRDEMIGFILNPE